MLFIDEIKEQIGAMLHPGSTIKSRSAGAALKYYYMVTLIPLILSVAIVFCFGSLITGVLSALQLSSLSSLSSASTLIILGIAVLFLWVIEPIILLIDAAIIQVIGGNLFKAFKGRYSDTLSVLVYASCTEMLFVWVLLIPLIGMVAIFILGIWAFIIEIIGIAKLQKTSRLAAFAIIIGVGIVLAMVMYAVILTLALLSLGTGVGSTLSSGFCVPSAGYLCTTPTYHHSTGQLTVTIGQSTGTNFTGWGIAYAPQGANVTSNGSPNVEYYAMNGSLASGAQKTVTLPASAAVSVGTTTSGHIWLCYYTASGAGVVGGMGSCTPSNGAGQSAVYYTQMATLDARAV